MRAPGAWVEAEKHVPGVRQCPEMVVRPSRWDRRRAQPVVTINEPVAAGKLGLPVDQLAAFVRELGMKERFYLGFQESWRNPGFARMVRIRCMCELE
jgi:hypothetical protein